MPGHFASPKRLGASVLDLDVDAGRELNAVERVNCLRGVLDDVEEPLVGPASAAPAAVLSQTREGCG